MDVVRRIEFESLIGYGLCRVYMCLSCLDLSLEPNDGWWQRRRWFLEKIKKNARESSSSGFTLSRPIFQQRVLRHTFDGETRSPASCVLSFLGRTSQFTWLSFIISERAKTNTDRKGRRLEGHSRSALYAHIFYR